MPRRRSSRPSFFSPRVVAACGLCLIGAWLAMLSFAASSSGSSNAAHFRAGDPVVPSEFTRDLRDLPQTITDAERKTFIRPLELNHPLPVIKQVLPGIQTHFSNFALLRNYAANMS